MEHKVSLTGRRRGTSDPKASHLNLRVQTPHVLLKIVCDVFKYSDNSLVNLVEFINYYSSTVITYIKYKHY